MAKLYFYYSAMNAGKTTTLLQSAYNYRERGMRTLILTPALDDRGGEGVVASRIGLAGRRARFGREDDLLALVREDIAAHGALHCVLVDEAQFLTRAQVWQLTDVVDVLRIPVLAYGLRTDFRGELFEGSQYLLAWADKLHEIKTICHTGKKATMVVRVDEAGRAVHGRPAGRDRRQRPLRLGEPRRVQEDHVRRKPYRNPAARAAVAAQGRIAMNNEAAPWTRPYFWRSDGKAMLLYFVFGEFSPELQLDVGRHGSRGLPDGVALHRFDKAMLAHWEGHPLRGALGEILREDDPEAFKAARSASACLMLRGELDDPSTLDYLRDSIGMIGALLDAGGAVVVDPQMLALFSAACVARALRGRRRRAARARAGPGQRRRRWQGLGAHARHAQVRAAGHQPARRAAAGHRTRRRAGGTTDRDAGAGHASRRGTALEVDGVPPGMTARLGGSLEDPGSTIYMEFTWPDA